MTTTLRPASARAFGDVVEIDGVPTYFEVRGEGEPVVLLHGGLCTAESFDAQTEALCRDYRVYVPERHGHGRTPDVPGPITYESMATHTIGFLDTLGLSTTRLAGWSDGALVGLLVALRRPALVHKLALVDQPATIGGLTDEFVALAGRLTPEHIPPPLRAAYDVTSPDGPAHFPVVFEKMRAIWTVDTGVDVADLARIAAPTLLLAADQGSVRFDHLVEVFATLPDAQLAVVPGTSHGLPMEKPDLVSLLLLDFFADTQVSRMF